MCLSLPPNIVCKLLAHHPLLTCHLQPSLPLQAWLAAAGGAQGASDGNLDMCADIQRALSCLREGLGSLREVLEALSLAAAQLPDAYDLAGADAKLWGFAPGYDARLVHDTTVAEQRQGLEQLQAQAASVLRILD